MDDIIEILKELDEDSLDRMRMHALVEQAYSRDPESISLLLPHYHEQAARGRNDTLELTRTVGSLADKVEELELLAHRDPLTDVPNRRACDERGPVIYRNALTDGKYLLVCMIDIDHFKNINDSYGHNAGDSVLCSVSQELHSHCRETDFFGRYGGEEFEFVAVVDTYEHADDIAERLRFSVENVDCMYDDVNIPATVSIGYVVADSTSEESFAQLRAKADQALYVAKETGRNRVMRYMEYPVAQNAVTDE